MTRLRAMIRARLRDDRGITMTEVMVAMFVTTIVVIAAGAMFIQTTKVTSSSTQTNNSSGQASNAMDAMSAAVRMATAVNGSAAVSAASGTSITLTTFINGLNASAGTALDPAPTQVTYTLSSAGVLTERQCTAAKASGKWSFATCEKDTTRTLAAVVQKSTAMSDGSTAWLLAYSDASGAAIQPDGGTVSATDLPRVAEITVTVTALAAGSSTPPITLQNDIPMTNIAGATS